ncbi:transposase family protein [Actinoplanes sp. M2I2]|uniref:transposase family protein n=1 Tax=Actinoplanes sp. M2I2 TaxID=1734444 RepID=UPI002020A72F|nr:transposase family protein [Actinoplanes sp. M2I2]
MASSLITALTVTTPHASSAPVAVTDGEHSGLLNALTKIPDPRDPRGIRYPLSAVLTVAVCAVMAGASSFAAITDWLHDLDEHARIRLGFGDGVPVGTTMWRLLIRLDPALLATVLAGWLHTRTQQPSLPLPRRYRRVIAIDGKTLRGARLPGGRQVHLLSVLDTTTGIVIA